MNMTLLSGENLPFIESLYTQYLSDPSSVDPSWVPLFEEYFGKERNGGIKTKPSECSVGAVQLANNQQLRVSG